MPDHRVHYLNVKSIIIPDTGVWFKGNLFSFGPVFEQWLSNPTMSPVFGGCYGPVIGPTIQKSNPGMGCPDIE